MFRRLLGRKGGGSNKSIKEEGVIKALNELIYSIPTSI